MDIVHEGLSGPTLHRFRVEGRDDQGNPVEPVEAHSDDLPLRCCLTLSRVGETLLLGSASPFPWDGPYREFGPVFIHADPCTAPSGAFPDFLHRRAQVVKAFGTEGGRRTQIYDRNRLVAAGDGLPEAIAAVLADPRVEFVHTHNVLAQCYNMTARLRQR